MKIVICASIAFTNKIKEVSDILTKQGHRVEIPYMARKILDGEVSLREFLRIKKKNVEKLARRDTLLFKAR